MDDVRSRRAEMFNRKAKTYRQLNMHEPVYVQVDPNKAVWQKGNIIATPTRDAPRSYQVQLQSGQQYKRNRIHIRPDRGTTDVDNESLVADIAAVPRRSARERYQPNRLTYERLGEPAEG